MVMVPWPPKLRLLSGVWRQQCTIIRRFCSGRQRVLFSGSAFCFFLLGTIVRLMEHFRGMDLGVFYWLLNK